jgi:hypothetical protein
MEQEDGDTIVNSQFTLYEGRFVNGLNIEHQAIYRNFKHNIETTVLDFIAVNIRYFTSHGKKHSEEIIRQINYMLPDDFEMSSSEKLVLLCAI